MRNSVENEAETKSSLHSESDSSWSGAVQRRHGCSPMAACLFQHIEALHERLHAVATKILTLNAEGEERTTMESVADAFALRDDQLKHLSGLIARYR